MKLKNFFNKFALIGSFSFLVVVAIIVGCQKDFTATDFGVKSTSVSNYQKWFEAYTNEPQNAIFAISENYKGKIEPIWEKAIQIDNYLLELPFKLDGKGVSRNLKGYQEGKVSLTLRANTDGTFKGFVIAITPSKGFAGSVDRINIQNFKDEKFDGIISLYGLRGNYLDGYLVKGGKIVTKIKHDAPTSRNSEMNASLQSCIQEVCYYIDTEWCQCVCQGATYSCRNGYNCTPPECRTSTETVCYLETVDCDGGCPDPNYPNCGNCPDPANPNCGDNCPDPNNPNCNGGGGDDGGGCLTGDCLNCAVHPEDPRCCKCNNTSEKKTACQKEFNFLHVTHLNVTVEVGLTSKNCRTGTATCSNNFYIFNPTLADINPIINNVELWAIQPYPNKTNCGFNATYWSRGLITVTPKYLAAGETGDTRHFEGWPNFNID